MKIVKFSTQETFREFPKKVCQWLFKFCPNFKDSKDFRTFLWLANTWAQLLICSWFPYTDQESPQHLIRNQLQLSWHLGWIPGKLCCQNKSWQLQCPLHMHCKCSHLPFRFSFWKLVFWSQIHRATSCFEQRILVESRKEKINLSYLMFDINFFLMYSGNSFSSPLSSSLTSWPHIGGSIPQSSNVQRSLSPRFLLSHLQYFIKKKYSG